MRLIHAVLVIVDISGYTAFINNRKVSLLHAEEIITALMESVIDRAEHPLVVNKLEGDAALLYCECGASDGIAARDVLAQVKAFFVAFYQCLAQQRELRGGCNCDACSNMDQLALKAFVHAGEFALKRVRQFEELAGEEVILIHRLLKNTVPSREYVLLTEAARGMAAWSVADLQRHRDQSEGLQEAMLWLAGPANIPFELPETRVIQAGTVVAERERVFHHLPGDAPQRKNSLLLRIRRLFGWR